MVFTNSYIWQVLLATIREWPHEIYDVNAVLLAVKSEFDASDSSPILMECLAEL
jgi:hypothetical protein